MRGRNAATTVDARAGSDIQSIVALEFPCALLNAHGADLVHDPVELLKSGILGASNADDLALAERLEADGKRADIAAEEARHEDGSDEAGDGKDDLDPANDATSQKDLRVPHDHPWEVGEESGGRREDGEGRVRGLPARIIISKVVLSGELSRGVTLRSDVDRPEKRNTKDCVLDVLKLPGGAAAETNALDGNDGHDILKKTHWASPCAESTASDETSANNHSDGEEGEDGVSDSNLKRLVSAMHDGERGARGLEVRDEGLRGGDTEKASVHEHQNADLYQEADDVDCLKHSSF